MPVSSHLMKRSFSFFSASHNVEHTISKVYWGMWGEGEKRLSVKLHELRDHMGKRVWAKCGLNKFIYI